LDTLAEKVPERKEMLKELELARRQVATISGFLIGPAGKGETA
jgi:hypothetical protein